MADKAVRLTTPRGIAQYAWLNKADTKFNENGEYKVNLVVDKKEAAPFVKKVAELRDEHITNKKQKKAALPFEDQVDDQGNATGKVIIKCKVKNQMTKDGSLWDRKPRIFDAKGNPINPNVGGGSTIKLNVAVYVWDVATAGGVGVMLQPTAVQVIDLVEYGGGEAAGDFGFDEEDGYVSKAGEFDSEVETLSEEDDGDLY